ncbi:MAG: orotidine-5'-phosphate decarboxylase [Thermoplasmataceae archaeon]
MDKSKIIASLDLTDQKKLIDIAENISEEIFAIKINWPTIMSCGIDIVGKLSNYSKVICDLKIADIPYTNEKISGIASKAGAWGIITHIFPGEDSLQAVIKGSGDSNVFGIVSMSNPDSEKILNRQWEPMIELCKKNKIYGIVAPANNQDLLIKIREKAEHLKIIAPGSVFQGGDPILTLENGADYVIIGRGVYESNDPFLYVKNINNICRKNGLIINDDHS